MATTNDNASTSNPGDANTPTSNTGGDPSVAANVPTGTDGTANNITQGTATATSTSAINPAATNSTAANASGGSSSTASPLSSGTRVKVLIPKITMAECNTIVDCYHKHQHLKIGAVLEIQEKLRMVQGMSDQDRKGGLAAFLEMLDNADKEEEEAVSRGKKRACSPGKKASKEDDTEYPWSRGNLLSAVAMDDLSPICRQTLHLLSKKALRSLQLSPLCPDLPESELKAILLNKPVNLDVVFTSLYSNTYTEDRTEDLADGIQIRFGNQVPSKQITDSNEWGVVWHKVATAYTHIFPHLELDVRAYGEYIHRQFAAVKKTFYPRVIHFNKAVCSRITNSRSIRFTDFSLFSDLRESHISNTGSCVDEAPQRSNCTMPTKSRVPCNNWNMGFCSASASTCTRLHICNVCELPSHRSSKCPLLPNKTTPPSSILPAKPPPSNVPPRQ
ncbi:hypothetical protein D9758_008924 [Tetrapyrgos nigripes]|uniref:C3H1-type domain-containing protein n=1 Tax=Tetrapyrgos nigripes TaxID=182062 RepID=A0A8H5GKR3_9AGAR|nr:hypothetical protein D9758_008924 [Tetrapyrgos nigripes]